MAVAQNEMISEIPDDSTDDTISRFYVNIQGKISPSSA